MADTSIKAEAHIIFVQCFNSDILGLSCNANEIQSLRQLVPKQATFELERDCLYFHLPEATSPELHREQRHDNTQ
jgi:hypothetical protein